MFWSGDVVLLSNNCSFSFEEIEKGMMLICKLIFNDGDVNSEIVEIELFMV